MHFLAVGVGPNNGLVAVLAPALMRSPAEAQPRPWPTFQGFLFLDLEARRP